MKRIWLILLCAILLAGCAGKPKATPQPTPTATPAVTGIEWQALLEATANALGLSEGETFQNQPSPSFTDAYFQAIMAQGKGLSGIAGLTLEGKKAVATDTALRELYARNFAGSYPGKPEHGYGIYGKTARFDVSAPLTFAFRTDEEAQQDPDHTYVMHATLLQLQDNQYEQLEDYTLRFRASREAAYGALLIAVERDAPKQD